jgi:hypothetical protein
MLLRRSNVGSTITIGISWRRACAAKKQQVQAIELAHRGCLMQGGVAEMVAVL